MSAACPAFAFELVLRLTPGLDAGGRGALQDALAATVASHGLSTAGGGDAVLRYRITRDGGQAIDADREVLRAWAAGRPEVAEVAVGPLVDLHEAGV